MSWNYRVIEFIYDGEAHLQMHEVYYDEADHPKGYTENPVTVTSNDGVMGLYWVLHQMEKALFKPILSATDFPAEAAATNQSLPEA